MDAGRYKGFAHGVTRPVGPDEIEVTGTVVCHPSFDLDDSARTTGRSTASEPETRAEGTCPPGRARTRRGSGLFHNGGDAAPLREVGSDGTGRSGWPGTRGPVR